MVIGAEIQGQDLFWDENGVPYSRNFNDKYFCREHGYVEARFVGCGGNNLQARFSTLDPEKPGVFTIIETGFGTGLDFCCAWQMWEEFAPASWRLHFVTVELYPLSGEQIARALSLWPELAPYRQELVGKYAPVKAGVGDYVFLDGRLRLTILFKDVVPALREVHEIGLVPGGADAWFLDGFGPAVNPQMWADEVFLAMAPLSKCGTTLSTFTVAGAVRRGLEAAGFKVARSRGHGMKKHILTGCFEQKS